jgi:hypothetical protein
MKEDTVTLCKGLNSITQKRKAIFFSSNKNIKSKQKKIEPAPRTGKRKAGVQRGSNGTRTRSKSLKVVPVLFLMFHFFLVRLSL